MSDVVKVTTSPSLTSSLLMLGKSSPTAIFTVPVAVSLSASVATILIPVTVMLSALVPSLCGKLSVRVAVTTTSAVPPAAADVSPLNSRIIARSPSIRPSSWPEPFTLHTTSTGSPAASSTIGALAPVGVANAMPVMASVLPAVNIIFPESDSFGEAGLLPVTEPARMSAVSLVVSNAASERDSPTGPPAAGPVLSTTSIE